jgi:serine O-acetyltransferase
MAIQTDTRLSPFLERLCAGRQSHRLPFQLRELSESFAQGVLQFLFPHFAPSARCEPSAVAAEEARLRALLTQGLGGPTAPTTVEQFFAALPAIYEALLADVDALFEGDPAARSHDEVIVAYPGFFAVALHRIAHALHQRGALLFARLIAEYAHSHTGIDIHPGAAIGARFAIDHGTGIVIGETAVLGDRVKLYQGVTLGAASVRKDLSQVKRHPTIGNGVVIYANATILGGDTVVGDDSIIGGNVWLTHSVPPKSVVTHSEHQRRQRAPTDDALEFHL